MNRPFHLSIIALVMSCGGGCTTTRYLWNDYDEKLYEYYKDPLTRDRFTQALLKTVTLSERKGNTPPGIYAEYGYLLLEAKEQEQACIYFAKEAATWPESRFFMAKMIRNATPRNGDSGGIAK